jgi:3-oxoadipate enol-lactonase|nr:3-oxoadipate enol-lactonase [Intestinirhabdus alba]
MVNYQIDGPEHAPVVILSNSLGTTLEMWQPQMPALTARYRVVRYDTRGHGGTRAAGNVDLAQLGLDVIDLLDHLQIARAHFCGISMGGLTGLWLARYRPQRLLSATVINSAARIGDEKGWRQRARTVREEGLSAIAASAPERWFTPAFRQASPQIVSGLCQRLAESSAGGYAACCEALAKADMREAIAAITLPVLLIAGQYDPVTTLADAQLIQQRIVGAQLAVVPASHLSSIEVPESVNRALLYFLEEQYAG